MQENTNTTDTAIDTNRVLTTVICQCNWCFKPIFKNEITVNHEIMGIVHEECVSDFENDCMNALCGMYS